ncbi:hypothetical protein GmHk_17G049038 [Glycine max]|nr:hypothetical protein GmHk_17G049038 [Glycine max]
MKGKQELSMEIYDPENASKELAYAIILSKYLLSIMDHLCSKKFIVCLQPTFQEEISTTLKLLDSLDGRNDPYFRLVDVEQSKEGYMVVTTHYIDGSWTLQSYISSTNDAMIDKIKDKLKFDTLLRDESLMHMCCCVHILNLIMKDRLEVVKEGI